MNLLEKLIETHGVSGSEDRVRKIIRAQIRPYVDDIRIDAMGNLIAHKKGKKPRVMLAAHMDEVGLMVRVISEKGHIYFSAVGGIEPLTLIGQRVHIHTKKGILHGVITTKEIHDDLEIEDLPDMPDLYVDAGLPAVKLKKIVSIGDYLSLEQEYGTLGNKEIISGKALDDRVGCFILLEVAKKLRNVKYDVYYVFTVQEEVGLYGAKTSAFTIEPDFAIAVDVTNANDFGEKGSKFLGRGPCLTVKDADMLGNRELNNKLKALSKKKRIPLQFEVSDLGTTDALSISLSRGGVPSTAVSVPIRNLHTTVGIVHKSDIENAITLLTEFLKSPPKGSVI